MTTIEDGYLTELMPVIVVDGSTLEVFQAAHTAWPDLIHVRPAADIACANGKVRGVLTGLRHVDQPIVVIADDDVRYTAATLAEAVQALGDADLLRPQNYFEPLPWHALWDTGRILLNRVIGGDFPGTLVVRTASLRARGGYDGDVLFENLELIRTIAAHGGRCVDRPDLYVRRLPPTARHFLGQRVRQAYDEFARPARLVVQLAIVPVVVGLLARRRTAAVGAGALILVAAAELGRRRHGGRAHFPGIASWWVPVWVIERGVGAWCALGARAAGGVPYAGGRLRRAANSTRRLRRRIA